MDNSTNKQRSYMFSVAFLSNILMIPFGGGTSFEALIDSIPEKNKFAPAVKKDLTVLTYNTDHYSGYTATKIANILTRTIYAEAMSENIEGKRMVATVILNRAGNDLKYIPEVCFAKKQFSCWNNYEKKNKTPEAYISEIPASVFRDRASLNAWYECKKIVNEILSGTFEKLGNWNSYYNPAKSPKVSETWGLIMIDKKTVGNHIFGYLPEHDGNLKRAKKFVAQSKFYSNTFPTNYVVQSSDKCVSQIAYDLISNGKTPYTDPQKLIKEIIDLNNLGTNAIIHINDDLKLPTL